MAALFAEKNYHKVKSTIFKIGEHSARVLPSDSIPSPSFLLTCHNQVFPCNDPPGLEKQQAGTGQPLPPPALPPWAAAAIQGTQPIQLTMTAQSSHQQREEAILLPRLSLSLLSAPAFRQPNTRPHQGTGLDGKKKSNTQKGTTNFQRG